MALTNRFCRGLSLFAFLFLFHWGDSLPSSAQDTGPIAAGSSSYQNAPVNSILDLYERLSEKHLIRDAQLSGVPPMSINVTGLDKADTIKLIEATLLLNGVTLVPVDEHNVKVVTVGTNKNPRSEGVRLYANAVDLPVDDQVVSYYMPLNYINPAEAAGIFTQVAPPHTGYGAYVAAPTAQAVVLTENVSVIRQLIALKELIDAPPAHVVSEWVQLNRADSDKVADILNKMLGLGPNGASTAPPGPGGPVYVPASLGNSEPLSNEKNLISGTAQIVSDPRSNRILVITRAVNMPFLQQMIAQLDQPDIFMVPQRIPLKYVLAQDILPALEAALAVGKDEVDEAKKDATAAGSKNANGQPTGAGGNNAPAPSGGGSGGTGSVSNITPQLAAPNENDAPTVVTVGNTRLMADNRSNSIIIFGSPDIVSRTTDMIAQLDRKPLQVYLATVIGQLEVKEGLEFGIDILQNFQKVGQGGLATGLVTPGTTTSAQVPIPTSLTSSLGFPLPTGLTLYGAIGSTLSAYVRALETTNRFKIISRPSVYTTNNKLAVIASGSQIPVPSNITTGVVSSTTTDNGLATTASVTYEDVLLQLDIIPLINANHEVTLKIRQTNNTEGNNVIISGNEVPIINTQEINTEITVPNKSTVVIGGLITDNTTRNVSGVPFLSDIPLLGYLFSDTTKDKQRDELIIMIQPSVIETDADQIAVNEEEKQRTILGREAVDAAEGAPGELPQSQSTAQPLLVPQIESKSMTIRATPYNSKSGSSTTTTTTTSTLRPSPVVETPLGPSGPNSPVPAMSSPAPDVSNGQMPKINPPSPPTTAP